MATKTMIQKKYRARFAVLDSGEVIQVFDEGFQTEHEIWRASPIFTAQWIVEDDRHRIWLCRDGVVEPNAVVNFREKHEFANVEAALMAARMKEK